MFYCILGGETFKMLGIRVVKPFILGERGLLECDYDLEESEVYSVKWYKDGYEFYRFLPRMEHQTAVFSVPGVKVDQGEPSMKSVEVSMITRHTGGIYSCEVISTNGPEFNTGLSEARVIVTGMQDLSFTLVIISIPSYSLWSLYFWCILFL